MIMFNLTEAEAKVVRNGLLLQHRESREWVEKMKARGASEDYIKTIMSLPISESLLNRIEREIEGSVERAKELETA